MCHIYKVLQNIHLCGSFLNFSGRMKKLRTNDKMVKMKMRDKEKIN